MEYACVARFLGSVQDVVCGPYIDSGELVEICQDIERVTWPIYAFCPRQAATPPRVRKVIDLLADSFRARLPRENR